MKPPVSLRSPPLDQAAGLRSLFARRHVTVVPVLDNPGLRAADTLLDALVGAYLERGLHVLVVDAGQHARPASELAHLNLAACIEPLSAQVGWLEARGLIAHHIDARGSAAALLPRLQAAAPQADLLLLRAPAPELARVLAGGEPHQPLLLADAEQANVTAAYAGLKWLAERGACKAFQLLLAGQPEARLTQRIAEQLGATAERFLGVALSGWAALPGPAAAPSTALRRLAHRGLQHSGAEGVVAA